MVKSQKNILLEMRNLDGIVLDISECLFCPLVNHLSARVHLRCVDIAIDIKIRLKDTHDYPLSLL